jgi:hypothetical protein
MAYIVPPRLSKTLGSATGGSEAGTWAGRVGDIAARMHRDRSLLFLLTRSRRAARTTPRDESVCPIHTRGTGLSLRADGNQPIVT